MKYEFIALLPMKGHSERVSNKNIKILHGKPLFFYIADTLKDLNIFSKLVINTDSDKISELAEVRYGDWVKIHKRPDYLIGDKVSMNKIISYDIRLCGEEKFYLQTHSTNPLLRSNSLIKAINYFKELFIKNKDASLFSVNKIQSRLYSKDLSPINHDPNILQRTQDLNDIYEENSCFYIFRGETFFRLNHRISDNPYVFPLSRNSREYLDIDDLFDWNLVENILTITNK